MKLRNYMLHCTTFLVWLFLLLKLLHSLIQHGDVHCQPYTNMSHLFVLHSSEVINFIFLVYVLRLLFFLFWTFSFHVSFFSTLAFLSAFTFLALTKCLPHCSLFCFECPWWNGDSSPLPNCTAVHILLSSVGLNAWKSWAFVLIRGQFIYYT